jgi:hypothetical protein
MSSDVVIPLVAAFIASILTIIGSLVVARYQAGKANTRELTRQTHEHREARLLDVRHLRDAKRERLRRDYVDIAFAADNFQSASISLTILWAGDTPEARGERIQEQLKEATDDLGRAIIRLQLEEGTQRLVEAYKRIRGNWLRYQYEVVEADREHDHTQVAKTMEEIETDVEAIIAMAKADLDKLGKPI